MFNFSYLFQFLRPWMNPDGFVWFSSPSLRQMERIRTVFRPSSITGEFFCQSSANPREFFSQKLEMPGPRNGSRLRPATRDAGCVVRILTLHAASLPLACRLLIVRSHKNGSTRRSLYFHHPVSAGVQRFVRFSLSSISCHEGALHTHSWPPAFMPAKMFPLESKSGKNPLPCAAKVTSG